MVLSNEEIKDLQEKAESYAKLAEKGNFSYFEKAVGCYDKIIENAAPHPHYFAERANTKHLTSSTTFKYSLDDVIKDMDRAIELNPDQEKYYKERGTYLLDKWEMLRDEKNISENMRNQLLEKAVADFKACISRNPSHPEAWLYLMETNILLQHWDDVISIYGQCKPYISEKCSQVIRSWLGCLAMAFAGDPIEEGDKKPLYDHAFDQTIDPWVTKPILHIVCFCNEVQKKGSFKAKWGEINEINDLLIDHIRDLAFKGMILSEFGRDEEALQALKEALKLNPNDFAARMYRVLILVSLKRYGQALKAAGIKGLFQGIRWWWGIRKSNG